MENKILDQWRDAKLRNSRKTSMQQIVWKTFAISAHGTMHLSKNVGEGARARMIRLNALVIGAAFLLACGGASPEMQKPSALGSQTPEKDTRRCGKDLGPSPFKNPNATHFLVADFWGYGSSSEANFSSTVTKNVAQALENYRDSLDRNPEKMDVQVPKGDMEIARLSCFIRDHEQAERIARMLGADVVIWGEAYCNFKEKSSTVVGNLSINPTVQNVQVGNDAQANLANVDVHLGPKPYTVCPSVTLLRSERRYRRDVEKAMDLASLGHLNLPALRATVIFPRFRGHFLKV